MTTISHLLQVFALTPSAAKLTTGADFGGEHSDEVRIASSLQAMGSVVRSKLTRTPLVYFSMELDCLSCALIF